MSIIKLQSEYDDVEKHQYSNGDIIYFKKETNIYHNPYGPAIIYKNGTKIYIIENKWHRLDGPAIISQNGVEGYYINDKNLTKEEFEYHPERLKFLGKGHLVCLR